MMPKPETTSVFESFNARALEPHQVARAFIPSEHFEALTRRQHSLIIGPRGSGKTTLLKMLQPQALASWQHPQADGFRKRVDFTGVFIPADISWERQLRSLGSSAEERAALAGAAFTTHVLRALVTAFEARTAVLNDRQTHFRAIPMSAESQAKASLALAHEWGLHLQIDSLAGVRHCLTARLGQIRMLGSDTPSKPPHPRWIHLPFLDAAAYALDIFEHAAQSGRERWALLFDELELAPREIRDELFRSLRSVDDRFLFKLSMSPFTKDFPDDHLSPMASQDYSLISLTYPNKEASYEFSEKIVYQMLKERGFEGKRLAEILAPSILDAGSDPAINKNKQRQIFKSLASSDPGFATHLADKNIDLSDNATYSSHDPRAIELRKVAHVATIREAFAKEGEARARKNPSVYHGATALFAIVEGNPRWLIGMMTEMLGAYDGKAIDAARQTLEIQKATNRFRALLRTIPADELPGKGALSVLDPIGAYFKSAVLFDKFSSEPPSSFIVDSGTGNAMLETLGRALNTGALVFVPDKDSQVSISSLRGKRFRLSFLLAPHYRLPLQLGRPVALSAVLSGSASRSENQHSLFSAPDTSARSAKE